MIKRNRNVSVVQSHYLVLSDFIERAELCEKAFAYEMVIATKHKKVNSGGVIFARGRIEQRAR